MPKHISQIKFAGIEYHGIPGVTRECIEAVVRLIHFGNRIEKARILTCQHDHCFLLSVDLGDYIAIKSGFASGYLGEGSRGFSTVLQILKRHGVEIEEYEVSEKIIQDIDSSSLLSEDLEKLESARPVRPSRWYDYLFNEDESTERLNERLRDEFPITVPLAIVDVRLVDLALALVEQTDHVIFTAFKRLEDTVRKRTGLSGEKGQKLFSQAFQVEDSILFWEGIEPSEQIGRANLFIGAFLAFRNRRAHQETDTDISAATREFLLLNELFLLESTSIKRPGKANGSNE